MSVFHLYVCTPHFVLIGCRLNPQISGEPWTSYRPQRKLQEGNVFTCVCPPQGVVPLPLLPRPDNPPWKEHGTRQEVTSYPPDPHKRAIRILLE